MKNNCTSGAHFLYIQMQPETPPDGVQISFDRTIFQNQATIFHSRPVHNRPSGKGILNIFSFSGTITICTPIGEPECLPDIRQRLRLYPSDRLPYISVSDKRFIQTEITIKPGSKSSIFVQEINPLVKRHPFALSGKISFSVRF